MVNRQLIEQINGERHTYGRWIATAVVGAGLLAGSVTGVFSHLADSIEHKVQQARHTHAVKTRHEDAPYSIQKQGTEYVLDLPDRTVNQLLALEQQFLQYVDGCTKCPPVQSLLEKRNRLLAPHQVESVWLYWTEKALLCYSPTDECQQHL